MNNRLLLITICSLFLNLDAKFTYDDIKNNKIPIAPELTNLINEELKLKYNLSVFDRSRVPFMKQPNTSFYLDPNSKTDVLSSLAIKDLHTAPASQKETIRKQLAGNYKIHLMPTTAHDIIDIISTLLKQMDVNDKFRNAIDEFKVRNNLDFSKDLKSQITSVGTGLISPIIVIYAANGKKNAQYVLDTVYKLFSNMQGLNETPRFNQKITSLIYYAQGNGDDKKNIGYAEYFEFPNKIFYKSDFVKAGHHVNYALENPAQQPQEKESESEEEEEFSRLNLSNNLKDLKNALGSLNTALSKPRLHKTSYRKPYPRNLDQSLIMLRNKLNELINYL